MNLNDFAKEVHENAVAHGWWETDRSFAECVVLIHSEWSEALEEARAGRPMVWHETYCDSDGKPVTVAAKPEGIAVELIDGVIRILDLFGRYGYEIENGTLDHFLEKSDSYIHSIALSGENISKVILFLHYMTSMAGMCMFEAENIGLAFPLLEKCAGIAIWWVQQQGLDPEKILREKHEYNKTRPYKHGKQF